jgi:peptide/nickel transport system substrate-binding protein
MTRLYPVLALFSLVLLTSCDNDRTALPVIRQAGTAAYGDSLVEGSIGEPSTLIPVLASDSSSHAIAGLVYNGLVKYDKNLNLVGDLAKRWDISPDGLTITFHLHKGVKWHDGHPFTSRDVLYTYKVTIDPKTPTAYAEDFKQVRRAVAVDPLTFRVEYSRPFAPALASWGMNILPAHLLEGKDITKSELARKPVGTGPYCFREWIPGQKLVLDSYHEYFEGRPYIDHRIYRIIPDTSTMYMELKAGGLDMMNLTPVQFQRQTNSTDFLNRFNKYRYPVPSYAYLGYNLNKELFSDKRVRQAITSAINKDELVQGVLFGLGESGHTPYQPGTWAYNPAVKPFPYDPQRAISLLAEAGWSARNSDGVLTKNGKPFSFTIVTNQGNEQRIKTAQIIQFRLKKIGIDVKIRVLEWASLLTNYIDPRNFDAVLMGWKISQDPDQYDIWHSSKTGPKELNFIGYKNPEVDRLLEEGRGTFDRKKRMNCYYRMQEIIGEDQPYTFLYVPAELPVVNARFRGIEPAPAGIGHNIIKWYVPVKEQLSER